MGSLLFRVSQFSWILFEKAGHKYRCSTKYKFFIGLVAGKLTKGLYIVTLKVCCPE